MVSNTFGPCEVADPVASHLGDNHPAYKSDVLFIDGRKGLSATMMGAAFSESSEIESMVRGKGLNGQRFLINWGIGAGLTFVTSGVADLVVGAPKGMNTFKQFQCFTPKLSTVWRGFLSPIGTEGLYNAQRMILNAAFADMLYEPISGAMWQD